MLQSSRRHDPSFCQWCRPACSATPSPGRTCMPPTGPLPTSPVQVVPYLEGEYTLDMFQADMRAKVRVTWCK